ncbi:alpha/beta hydrolase [Marinimicrobium sp. C6131]|uniref:alpha/beta hydrolase n=1 Tax=Marinimicrobium sp. C6131 TaxID=3022676 RepID=UPI00223CD4E7|nr:alpha/beta hydrolase [Marinimicrobium sp. C6131]UZJ44831.1 alpha/beta hydrolase [Marinimicrobium sp. C6131]
MTVFSQTETAITINGPAGALEARIQAGAETGALSGRALTAIVCHPHPQHGGTMSNKVVTTLVRTYRDLGVATVRFNFRGVGASEGTFDNAVGEVDDLLAVRDWLANQRPDGALLLAGFSFGSAVAAGAVYRAEPVEHLTLIAPPVERYAYDRDGRFPCPVCIAQGERDDVVVPEGVIRWSETQLQSPHVLLRYPQAGHFFHGQLTVLKTDLASTIQRQLGAAS